jgi:hypothetical protein
MTAHQVQPSATLLQEISRDLQPVRSSPPPWGRALRAVPVAVAIAAAMVLVIGLRTDVDVLGPLVTWGGSGALLSLGVLLVWIAARESTPGSRLPQSAVHVTLVIAWPIVAAIAGWTYAASVPAEFSSLALWRAGWVCAVGGTVAGGLVVMAFAWSFQHPLAARPALAGALYGTAAGLIVNAGWRLACPISSPAHVLGAHGPAIAATTLLGAFAAHLVARRHRRQV